MLHENGISQLYETDFRYLFHAHGYEVRQLLTNHQDKYLDRVLEASQTLHAFCPPHAPDRDIRHLFKTQTDGRIIAYQGGEVNGVPIPQFIRPPSSGQPPSSTSELRDIEDEVMEEFGGLHLGNRVGLEKAREIATTTTRVERAGVTHLVHHWAMQGHTSVCHIHSFHYTNV